MGTVGKTWLAEDAYSAYLKARPTIESIEGANESTTRMRAIDTVLFDVLQWDKVRVDTESYARAEGFSDYLFDPSESRALVLEAKRDGTPFVLPDYEYPDRPIPFSLLAQECPEADKALRQACAYAVSFGSRYVAISNGQQWILALTYIPGEPIEHRRVFVFESLDAIDKRFRSFFTCFGPLVC